MKEKIVTLCGSNQFFKELREIELKLIEEGIVVLSPVFVSERDLTANLAKRLGNMHLKKINLSDEIFVVDVNGYIGESTQKEISYARQKNKVVKYYSQRRGES